MARKSIILTTRLLPEEKAEAARRAAEAGLSLNAYVVRAISGEPLKPPLFVTDGEGGVQLIPEREALGEAVHGAFSRLSDGLDDIPWKDGELPRYTVRTPLPSGFATVEDGADHPASVEVVGATDAEDAQWMLDQAEVEADRIAPAGDVVRYGGGAGGGKTAGMKMAEAVHAVADAYGYSPSIPRVESPALRAMLAVWPGCQHPKTPENTRKVGKGRVACKECRKAVDRRHAEAKAKA